MLVRVLVLMMCLVQFAPPTYSAAGGKTASKKAPAKAAQAAPEEPKGNQFEYVTTAERFTEVFDEALKALGAKQTLKFKDADQAIPFILHAYKSLSSDQFRGIPSPFIAAFARVVNGMKLKGEIGFDIIHSCLRSWFGLGPIQYRSLVLGFQSVGEIQEAVGVVRQHLDEDFVAMTDGKEALLDASLNYLKGLKAPNMPAIRLGFFGGSETGKTSLPADWAKLMGFRVEKISLTQFNGDSPKDFVVPFLNLIAQKLYPNEFTPNSSVVFIFTNVEHAHPMIIEQIVTMMRDRVMHVNMGQGPIEVKLDHTGFILNTSFGTQWIDDFIAGHVTELNERRKMGFAPAALALEHATPLQLQQIMLRALLQNVDNEARAAQLNSLFSMMDVWVPCTPLDEKGFREALALSLKRFLAAKSSERGVKFIVKNEKDFLDYTMKTQYVASAKPGFALAVSFVERFAAAELDNHIGEWGGQKKEKTVEIEFDAARFEASMKPIGCRGLLQARDEAAKIDKNPLKQ